MILSILHWYRHLKVIVTRWFPVIVTIEWSHCDSYHGQPLWSKWKKSDRNSRHGLILLSRFYNDYYTLPQQNLNIFSLFSAMECLVKILLWSSLVTTWTSNHFTLAQSHFPTKFSKKEVFFVNLEEGYFGCQVNETLEVLQIFKIEKLCDGTSDCYLGSDENQKELKCSSKYFN